jgi:hypothetical protein
MRKMKSLNFHLFLLKLGYKRFLSGFDYFRWLEYPLVYNNLELDDSHRYLDIGSGTSDFPLFVLYNKKSEVHTIDDSSIVDYSRAFYKE